MRRGRHTPAFTLIELLLVIVIISLLLGITLPAMMQAKAAAVAVQCAARQSQLIVGTIMHAGDHKDLLPFPNWHSPQSDESNVGWLYAPPVASWDSEARKTGSLWNYVRAGDVYRCQAHRAEQEGSAEITSFLMNGAVVAYGELRVPRPFRLDQFQTMSAIFWDAEDVEIMTDSGLGGDRSDGATWPGQLPRPRHGNAINVAVIDGAVSRMSMEKYQAQQLLRPSMLWCVPNIRSGGQTGQ